MSVSVRVRVRVSVRVKVKVRVRVTVRLRVTGRVREMGTAFYQIYMRKEPMAASPHHRQMSPSGIRGLIHQGGCDAVNGQNLGLSILPGGW